MKRFIVAEGAKAQLRVATLSEEVVRAAKPGSTGTIEVKGYLWDMDPLAISRTLMSTIQAKILESAGDDYENISGIGVVLSAAINQEARIAHLSHVEGGIEESYAEMLAELRTSFPGIPILVDNRSNSAALAEYCIGWRPTERPNKHDVLFITISGNLGAGIVIDGKVWHGTKGVAGQIGHLVVNPESQVVCKVCNQRGCASELASGRALVRYFLDKASPLDIAAVMKYVTDAKSTSEVKDVGYRQAVEFQNNQREINSRAILLAARESKAAMAATDEFCRPLAQLIEELAYVLDPSIVILGGIAAARHELGRQVDDLIKLRYAGGGRPLLVSRLGDQAAFYGAALELLCDGCTASTTSTGGLETPADGTPRIG